MKKLLLSTICLYLLLTPNDTLKGHTACNNESFCPVKKFKEKDEPSKNVSAPAETKNSDEDDIPLTEDLMREHGVLDRVLLIYEEIMRRIDKNVPFSTKMLEQAVNIIKTFIEEYHEKMEENYLFPLFEKHKTEVRLVRTLKLQHTRGREITGKIKNILAGKTELDQRQKKMLKGLLQQFITMYRPHESRENTVLFPKVRGLMSEKEFKEMGEKFDDIEHQLFGKNGYQNMVDKVAALEKELGIYNLEQFTPA